MAYIVVMMDLDRQQAVLRNHLVYGSWRVTQYLNRNRADVVRIALARAAGQGFEDYGDKSFHMAKEKLSIETIEELADASVYQAIYDWHVKGKP